MGNKTFRVTKNTDNLCSFSLNQKDVSLDNLIYNISEYLDDDENISIVNYLNSDNKWVGLNTAADVVIMLKNIKERKIYLDVVLRV